MPVVTVLMSPQIILSSFGLNLMYDICCWEEAKRIYFHDPLLPGGRERKREVNKEPKSQWIIKFQVNMWITHSFYQNQQTFTIIIRVSGICRDSHRNHHLLGFLSRPKGPCPELSAQRQISHLIMHHVLAAMLEKWQTNRSAPSTQYHQYDKYSICTQGQIKKKINSKHGDNFIIFIIANYCLSF